MAVRDAFDEAVQPEPPEVVGHRPRGVRIAIVPLELCDAIAELSMPKAGGKEREETKRVHQGMDAAVAESEAGASLLLDADRGYDGV